MAARDFFAERVKLYQEIEKMRESRVIAYVTGDRANMETQIHGEVIDYFAEHLDALFPATRISLLLYTRGGSTLAAWNIVNLLRMFCDELEIIVPAKAQSAGTLMCLGADTIIMTKQATLGPIDPSLNSPLNPQIPGAPPNAKMPVSVEAVRGYLDMVKSDAGVADASALVQVILDLAQKVHPLVLGEIFRSRSQIQYLAGQLLRFQLKDKTKPKKIIDFLCSESGSHDYTINRREAAGLGLNVEKPGEDLYQVLRNFHVSMREEMELGTAFNPHALTVAGQPAVYSMVRCFIESVAHGSHVFVSEGTVTRTQVPAGPGVMQDAVTDARTFDGWRRR
jgi:hypothetical protein